MARIHYRSPPVAPRSAPALWSETGEAEGGNDSSLLALAESVGRMGHWRWDILSDKLAWSDQMFAILDPDSASFPLTFAAAFDICHPEDRAGVQMILDDAIARRAAFEFDCRIQRDDGLRTVICKGQPEVDANGAVTALFGVLADVTDAFAAIRAIDDQKEMLGLAAHLAHLGHWIWSEDEQRLALCSAEFARVRGLSPAEVARYVHPSQLAAAVGPRDRARYLDTVTAAIAAPRAYEIEYQLECAGGAVKDIREIGQPIVDSHGKLRRFIAAVQDISEAKRREKDLERAEEALQRRTAELQESNRQKDMLFSVIAHDLRNPFNTVMGFAEVLASSAKAMPAEKIAGYAEIVRDSAGDVQGLLDNLLAWAAMKIRDTGAKIAPFDLSAVAARSIASLERSASGKGVSIANMITETRIMGDADLICIVLRNLVSNGIKFSRPGGTIRLSAEPAGTDGFVKVTVVDEDVGISRADKNDLFAPSCATSEPGTSGEKGTGLGLYLCRDIIDRHGGTISVASAPGRGTTVCFTLPAAK